MTLTDHISIMIYKRARLKHDMLDTGASRLNPTVVALGREINLLEELRDAFRLASR